MCEYDLLFRNVGCTGTPVSVGWFVCWESFPNTLYVSAIFPSERLDAVYLSVGLKCRKFCWESCANTLYVSTIFTSDKLAAQVLLVCLHIGWFEVLKVQEGKGCLDRCVSDYHPSRDAGFLACLPVGLL